MIFNIPAGGVQKTTVTVYGAANETVTLTSIKGEAFTTDTDASGVGGTLKIPVGMYTVTGSYSGYTKKKLVLKTTTEVYAMPNGDIVYWYGYSPYSPKEVTYVPSGETSHTKKPTLDVYDRYLFIRMPSTNGTYCGSVMFDNVKTNGGVPTLISTGRKVSTSNVRVYFSIADNITGTQFETISSDRMDYGENPVTLKAVEEGTYDIAISARNYENNNHADVNVYAIYIADPDGESDVPESRVPLFESGLINRVITRGINGTVQDGVLHYNASVSSGANDTYTTVGMIDLTDINFIKARMKTTIESSSKNGAYFRLLVINSEKDGDGPGTSSLEEYIQETIPNEGIEKEVVLDVTGVTGRWYVGYCWGVLSSASGSRTILGNIYEWWME